MIGVIMAGGGGLVAIAAIHAMQEKKKNKKQSKCRANIVDNRASVEKHGFTPSNLLK